MQVDLYSKYVVQLFHLMLMFNIDRFEVFSETATRIKAKVGYPDIGDPDYEPKEEVQEIEWDIQFFNNIDDLLDLTDFIRCHKLIDIDKIIIEPLELRKLIGEQLNWSSAKFDAALDSLLNLHIDMIDDAQKTDYFFVHF